MFGMGMGEIILIAIVALLVVGPERLPGAAKAIGKGIRDLRAQTKDLQQTIEQDTQIGDAVREIRGAMRGDPETLYKRATGEDFNPSEAAKDSSSSDDAADEGKAEAHSEEAENGDDAIAAADSAAPTSAAAKPAGPKTPPPPIPKPAPAIAGGAATETAAPLAKALPKADPDLPLIRTPAGSMARSESGASSEDSTSDPEHG